MRGGNHVRNPQEHRPDRRQGGHRRRPRRGAGGRRRRRHAEERRHAGHRLPADAAASESRGAVRGRDGHAGRPDFRHAAEVRRKLEPAALSGGELEGLGRRHERDARPAQEREVPRRQAGHVGRRRLLDCHDQKEPPVQVDVRAGREGRHARSAHRHPAAEQAAPSDPAGHVLVAVRDHTEACLRRRHGRQATSP